MKVSTRIIFFIISTITIFSPFSCESSAEKECSSEFISLINKYKYKGDRGFNGEKVYEIGRSSKVEMIGLTKYFIDGKYVEVDFYEKKLIDSCNNSKMYLVAGLTDFSGKNQKRDLLLLKILEVDEFNFALIANGSFLADSIDSNASFIPKLTKWGADFYLGHLTVSDSILKKAELGFLINSKSNLGNLNHEIALSHTDSKNIEHKYYSDYYKLSNNDYLIYTVDCVGSKNCKDFMGFRHFSYDESKVVNMDKIFAHQVDYLVKKYFNAYISNDEYKLSQLCTTDFLRNRKPSTLRFNEDVLLLIDGNKIKRSISDEFHITIEELKFDMDLKKLELNSYNHAITIKNDKIVSHYVN